MVKTVLNVAKIHTSLIFLKVKKKYYNFIILCNPTHLINNTELDTQRFYQKKNVII